MSRLLPDHEIRFSKHRYYQYHSIQGAETINLRLVSALLLSSVIPAFAGQAPGAASSPDIAVSHRDRFYTSDQFSNTVSVIDPVDNKLLGVFVLAIRRQEISARSTKGNCWCTAWAFRPTIARSR